MVDMKKLKPSDDLIVEDGSSQKLFFLKEEQDGELRTEKISLLLHSCCGPCSTAVIEKLARQYKITVFFYNPNIHDREEYKKRKEVQQQFIREYNKNPDSPDVIGFLEGDYEVEAFDQSVSGLEKEPEGGKRCSKCFRLRLEKTAEMAVLLGNDIFTTTLTVSPHKNCALINKIGMDLALKYGISYLAEDFKKKAGYQRSIELSKKYNLYRQHFCGCKYSK